MIPRAHIVAWGNEMVDWPTDEQVEQDLALSRLIVEIANDPNLQEELVFRGGTCLHKLHLERPVRYSEDLDYVRRNAGGIGPLTQAVTRIGERLGMEVTTRVSQHPKVYLRAPFESGNGTMRVKVEINTFERSPARDVIALPYSLRSRWFEGSAQVQTFCLPELVATKIRALFQRRKGRDLLDLWLALTRLKVDPTDIIECFGPYRPEGYTGARARRVLEGHVAHGGFRTDLLPLLRTPPAGYDIDGAARLIEEALLGRL